MRRDTVLARMARKADASITKSIWETLNEHEKAQPRRRAAIEVCRGGSPAWAAVSGGSAERRQAAGLHRRHRRTTHRPQQVDTKQAIWQGAKERSTYGPRGPRARQLEADGRGVDDARPGDAVKVAAQRAARQLAGHETGALVEHAQVAALGGLHMIVGLGPPACAARSSICTARRTTVQGARRPC